MNKNTYTKERFSLYLFSIPMTILSLFIKRDKKRIIFNSFFNKKFNSNSKYLFLYFIENIKSYNSFFVINDDDLRNKLNLTIGNYFIETKSFRGKLFALRASIWFISTLAIPVGGFFLTYKRSIIHLSHGTPIKNVGLLENSRLDKKIYCKIVCKNISYSVASSKLFQPIISKSFALHNNKVLIAGQARNDQLFIKSDLNIKDITGNKNMKNILYAPTWRTTTKVKLFPFDDFLIKEFTDFLVNNNINIFIRIHPAFEDEIDSDILNMKNIYLFSGEKYPEIMDYLNIFDLLITDYSSIYFDYLLLDRPMVFLPYDYDLYNNEVGFTVSYHDYTPGYKPLTMKEFINSIYESFNGEDVFKKERDRVNKICNAYQQNNREKFIILLYKMGILLSRNF